MPKVTQVLTVAESMSAAVTDINGIRKKLVESLGSLSPKYFYAMKQWFRGKASKEEFDARARTYFQPDTVHLHNDFLLAILNRCQIKIFGQPTVASSSRFKTLKRYSAGNRPKRQSQNFQKIFDQGKQLSGSTVPSAKLAPVEELVPGGIQLCSREGYLPDLEMVHGRSMLIAWEMGLEDVQDEAARLVLIGLEIVLKNILQAIISLRRSHLNRDGRFSHFYGMKKVPSSLLNTVSVSAGVPAVIQSAKTFVSVEDLLDALEIYEDLVPSNMLRMALLERLYCSLDHLDYI